MILKLITSIIFILFILPIVFSVVTSVQPDGTIFEISGDREAQRNSEFLGIPGEPEFNGYIIQLKKDPLILQNKDLEKRAEENEESILRPLYGATAVVVPKRFEPALPSNIQDKLEIKKNQILEEHSDFKRKALRELNKQKITNRITGNVVSEQSNELVVLNEFSNVFNGIALDITPQEAKELKELREVEEVYPNYIVHMTLMDSVPLINADDVWQLDRNGNNCAQSGEQCLTGEGVTIGIIDTGVDYTHPDLGGCFGSECKVIDGYDFSDNDNDPMDYHGHGTHVAATAAGNGVLKGVAPDAKIVAYKVFPNAYDDVIIAAIEISVDPNQDGNYSDHLDIISLSLGGFGNPDDPLSQAIDNAVSNGIVAVIAAGNSGPGSGTISSPGTARKSITVGATDKSDNIAWFSSRGPVIWENGAIVKPDVLAPGVNICAAQWNGAFSSADTNCNNDDNHVAISGTSMATPHVSGVVALLLEKNPDWSPDEIKMALRNSAVTIREISPFNPQELPINTQGYGMIDALDAINIGDNPTVAILETSGAVEDILDVFGTATGKNFISYTLSYGTGLDPSEWTILCSSNNPIIDGILCSDLDANLLPEGYNSLQLLVESADGQISEDRTILIVNNIELSQPLNNDIFRLGDIIDIVGSIKSSGFQNYFIEYGNGENPLEWSTNGITLFNGGQEPIINDKLGTFNSGFVTNDGYYTIRLTVNYDNSQKNEYIKNIYIDSTLKEGWPKTIDWLFTPASISNDELAILNENNELILKLNYDKNQIYKIFSIDDQYKETVNLQNGVIVKNNGKFSVQSSINQNQYYWTGPLQTVVEDVNNDGNKEIFVYVGGNPTRIYAFQEDGTDLNGWPVDVNGVALPGGNLGSPSIADIDNDGFKEIIVNGMHNLFIYRFDGTLYMKIPLSMVSQPTTETVINDIDNDGNVEIIRIYEDIPDHVTQKVTVMDSNGKVLPGWPQTTYRKLFEDHINCLLLGPVSTPAVGDIDNDGENEIIVASIRNVFDEGHDPDDPLDTWHCEGRVYVFNLDGSVLDGFPVDIYGLPVASPTIADINNDGNNEIIIGTFKGPSSENSGAYVINKFGNVLEGWPQLQGQSLLTSASISDVNNDNSLEIGLSAGGSTYLFSHNGEILDGWPKSQRGNYVRSLISGDIDGDDFADEIVASGFYFNWIPDENDRVYAWSRDGLLIDGFPKVTEASFFTPAPTLSDLNNNGKVELIASSNWNFDYETGVLKRRSSIYVWELGQYNKESTPWPMFMHDPQHTGLYVKVDEPQNATVGNLIMKSPDGSCSACGPDENGNWGCFSVECPS